MKIVSLGFAGAALIGAVMFAGAANAAPMMPIGAQAGQISSDNLIVEVQAGRRGNARAFSGGGGGPRAVGRGTGARAFGGGGGRVVRRGGGIGPRGAAAIGLGVLGAAVAIGAAQSAAPRECWVEQQPVHDNWGNFLGYRNVRVCQRY